MNAKQRAELFAMRKALDGFVEKIVDNPTEINDNQTIIRAWVPGVYAVNDVRNYNGVPYKCTIAHDSTQVTDWTPEAAPSLWAHYHGTTPETARPFLAESHNPYNEGHYCIEDDRIYLCVMPNVAYAPSVLPSAWEWVE